MRLPILSCAVCVIPCALGQFVAAPTDLKEAKGYANVSVRYKEVPAGICELDPDVKSYSGYADVAEDQHIFWWFFESRNEDPSTAPLTVWINGGPGSSSMIGLFQELGPCGVDDEGVVYNNPYSWSNVSNMLFIDQPTQVGFSYSIPVPGYVDPDGSGIAIVLPNATCPDYAESFGTCGTYSYGNTSLTANSTTAAAPNFWKTLQGFMGAFPQYSRHGFHFATESYGGHYGPVFNEYIEQQNADLPEGAHEIHLETVLIGNGWYDPLLQYQAYYNYTVSPGNPYIRPFFNSSIAAFLENNLYGPGNCVDQLQACYATNDDTLCARADTFCAYEVESVYDNYAGRDEYDIRELVPDPFPYGFYVDYLNTAAVQRAIGAYQNFSESSEAVYAAFSSTGDDARRVGTVAAVRALLAQGVRVVAYFGDADYNCNFLGGLAVATELAAPGYAEAGFANLTVADDGRPHGEVREADNFAWVRIYESGHEVPFYQPLAALTLFSRAIAGRDLATGTVAVGKASGYRSVGPSETSYREGNATVQWSVLPSNATYNTTLDGPDPVVSVVAGRADLVRRSARTRSVGRRSVDRRIRSSTPGKRRLPNRPRADFGRGGR